MGVIVPAILPKSREDLEQKLARFDGLTDFVQIDIVDGKLASPATWPYTGGTEELAQIAASGGTIPYLGKMKFDIDLMVEHPEEVMGFWTVLGASRITVHAESTRYVGQLITTFNEKYGHERDFMPDLISLGLAISLQTDPAILEPFLPNIEYVQFMGIASIGKQGQPFDTRVVDRVRAFKKRHPDTEVQVDGGVTLETAPALLDAGADRLIVGHDLRDAPDLKAELAAFNELTEWYGLYD